MPNTTSFSSNSYPYYFDNSLPDGDIVTKTQLPKSFSRLQVPTVAQLAPPASSQAESLTSLDTFSSFRGTETHDLADFLRTSRPEDYRKFLKSSASDDQLFAHSYKKGLRFLSPSKWKETRVKGPVHLGAFSTLPTNVLARTTSRGLPYLQIHVDYAKTNSKNFPPSSTSDRTSCSFVTSEESDFYRHNTLHDSAIGGDSPVTSPRPSSVGDQPSLSPAPWGATDKVLDADTLETYHQFLNSERHSEALGLAVETKPRSLSIEAVGGESVRLSEYQKNRECEFRQTPPCSPRSKPSPCTPDASSTDPRPNFSSPHNITPSKVQSRSSSLKRSGKASKEASLQISQPAMYDDNTDTEREGTAGPHSGHRRHSKKAPPRPGPPPTRSLPSLPEGHNSALGKSDRISVVAGARNSVVSATDSFVSASTISETSSTSPSIENEIISAESSREQRVKARKVRDVQRIRLQRELQAQGKTADNNYPTILNQPTQASEREDRTPRASEIKRTNASQIRVILNEQLTTHSSAAFVRTAVPNGSPTPPHSPGIGMNGKIASNSSNIQSRPHSSSKNSFSEREVGLEARLLAVERKNRMLEQALIALIRGVMGQDERHTGLHRATGLGELLEELKSVDTSPSKPSSEHATGG